MDTAIGLVNTRFGSRIREIAEPLASVWFCSGHSPPLSQIGQSSGWFSSRNSRFERCAFSATGELSCVLTTMPSATVWVHAACGLGIGRPPISTSTRHCRHAPTGSSSGWSQNRGMAMPIRSAVRITSSPLGAMTVMPSIVSRTWPSGTGSGSGAGAAAGGLATCVISAPPRADLASMTGGVRPVTRSSNSDRKYLKLDRIGVAAASPSAQNERPAMLPAASASVSRSSRVPLPETIRRRYLHQPAGALPARRALAAGLVLVELQPLPHRPRHRHGLVETHQRGGAQHRPGRRHVVEGQRHVQLRGGEDRRRRSARGEELQRDPVEHPAGGDQELRAAWFPSGASYCPGRVTCPDSE